MEETNFLHGTVYRTYKKNVHSYTDFFHGNSLYMSLPIAPCIDQKKFPLCDYTHGLKLCLQFNFAGYMYSRVLEVQYLSQTVTWFNLRYILRINSTDRAVSFVSIPSTKRDVDSTIMHYFTVSSRNITIRAIT